MALPSRREVLQAGIAVAAGSVASRLALGESALERRQPRGLKVSCSSLAFSDMSWDKALGEIKKLGFRYADLAMFEGWTHISPSELTDPEKHAGKIRDVCGRLKIEPIALHANFNPGKAKDFPGLTTDDVEARKTILDHFDRVLLCAARAEIPLVNLQPGKFIKDTARQTCLDRAIELLKEMHNRARREGVELSFENHTGSIGEQVRDTLDILQAVQGLKLDYDFSHVVASSIEVEETIPLLKHVGHIGIRNAKPGSFNEPIEGDKLNYSLDAFLKLMRKAEVDAYVSIEYYQPAMRPQIARLKGILDKAGVRE